MLHVVLGIITRIVSNSYLNVFQKIMTGKGEKPSVINFYTYLGLTILTFLFNLPQLLQCHSQILNPDTNLIINFLIMGILGTLGNYYIIKALSIGELSTLAPINSYKPIIAMIIAWIYLKEIPSFNAIFAIALIITGTYIIFNTHNAQINSQSVFYRILALFFSASEAVFIKKLILISGIFNTLFLWALSGCVFSTIIVIMSKQKPKITSLKYQIMLILTVGIMQYSTNYVFSNINVSYALALFQLSTLLSVFLGVNIFGEKNLKQKLIGAAIMIVGAIFLIQLS